MFAKLKKKLIEEPGGNGGDSGDRSLSGSPNSLSSPSHANAFQRTSGTPTPVHSPLTKEPHAGGLGTRNFADNAVTPLVTLLDDSKVREANLSLEEVMMQLAKRTEQCKKMEGNISDLAALIKDKNRNIERLETQIKQHETVLFQKLAEQKADFEVYRDKLIAGYQEDKLALEKEKQELTQQLQEAKEYRDKYLQHEAETDEMQDFTAQELSKVKHMLLLAQGELESCQQDLLAKSQKLNTCEHKMKQLETQVVHLSQKTERMETECQRLLEDNRERAELVTSLTKEKSAFDRRLDELNKELTEKQNHIIELNMQLSDLDSKHRVLEHNTECHKSKMAKLLEEKQDHIETLLDRVATLELRLQDHNLSGDERVTALQAERDGLEKKLAEIRQQLTEIKSTWSDKISHLEEQISHLNSKIVEDSEELASSERATETMRENFHRQMEDLRSNLADAERRSLENLEIANSKDAHHEQIIHNMEMELTQAHFVAKDNDTQLRGKIASLEAQLSELETAHQAEQQAVEYKCRQLEEQHTQAVVEKFHNEQRLKAAEAQTAHLQNKLDAQRNELKRLHSVLESKEQTTKSYDQKLTEFENQAKELQAQLALSASQLSAMKKQLLENEQEKGELMVRNAQLSQQLNTHTHQENQQRQEVEGLLAEKDSTILDQLNTIQYLNNRLAQLEQQTAQASLVNTEDLRLTIHHLQDQLADKTRTLKKQEQTVKDLRQTLQRELKVQVLPNDELSDDNTSSPSMSRKFTMRNAASTNGSQFSLSISSSLTSTSQSSITTPSSFATAAVKPMTNSAIVPVSDQRGLVVRRDLEQDVNFQYLKHVVLKFMLSRESEAVQLIKAVAVLLNFTQQEQQLIKQTLEWKMSWFGSRPSLGKGQTAKMIPPSF